MKRNKIIAIILLLVVIFITAFVLAKTNFVDKISSLTANVNSSKVIAKMHFINLGNSDSILLESDGRYLLVDAGNPLQHIDPTTNQVDKEHSPATPKYSVQHVMEYLRKIGVKKLDYIIGTHNHSDHLGGMVLLAENGFVGPSTMYFYRGYVKTQEDTTWDFMDNYGYYTRTINAMTKKGAKLIDVTDKEIHINVGNYKIELLNTESWNNKDAQWMKDIGYEDGKLLKSENLNSIVEYVTIGSTKVLLSADMHKENENYLMRKEPKLINKNINIIKLGHHGLHTSTGYSFIDKIKPNDVIVTGEVNYKSFSRRAIPELLYIKNNYTKNIYYTSKVNDAIVVEFTKKNYKIKNSDNKTSISKAKVKLSEKKEGVFTKITGENDNQYAYYVLDAKGKNKSGWYTNNNKTYYLNPSNRGARETGWEKISNSWYYFDNNGVLQTGFKKIENKWYYLNKEATASAGVGAMVTGWKKIDNSWYYFDSDGIMQTGFNKIKGNWYYLAPSAKNGYSLGARYTNTTVTIEGKKFTFDASGKITDQNALNFKVTYCDNSKCSKKKTVNITYGQKFKILAYSTFKRTGYTNIKWTEKKSNGKKTYWTTENIDKKNWVWNKLQNVTLYATWKANTYTITFNKNSSSAVGTMQNQSMKYGTSKKLNANKYTNNGYSFVNWNTVANGSGKSYKNSQAVKNLTTEQGKTVTLYAIWKPNTYTITFNKNSNSAKGTMQNQSMTYGTSKKLNANKYTNNGYSFVNWNTASNGSGTSYTNGQSVSNLTTANGKTVTLYAIWQSNAKKTDISKLDIRKNKYAVFKYKKTLNDVKSLVSNNNITLKDKNNKAKGNNAKLGTNDNITIDNTTYTIVVKGDVTGTSTIDFTDVTSLYTIFKTKKGTEEQKLAGDVDDNGKIEFSDITSLYSMYKRSK